MQAEILDPKHDEGLDYIDHQTGHFISEEVLDTFFAPVQHDVLSTLVSEFNVKKKRIEEVAEIITPEKVTGVMRYFFDGNSLDEQGMHRGLRNSISIDQVFRVDGAIMDLTSEYWQRALDATNLMELMPAARRKEWNQSLNAWRASGYKPGVNPEHDMPVFNIENLRASIVGLLARRPHFLAERVDGVFRELSPNHKTNRCWGFMKRMIIAGMFCEFGTTCHYKKDSIHDLRMVIAKFMGRDEPSRSSTDQIMMQVKAHRGEWVECDAGSLRLRGYQVGTCHLEIHPEMAWRLNSILAFLYPTAIPESSRSKPATKPGKDFKSRPLFERPLSNELLTILASAETYYTLEPRGGFGRDYNRIQVENTILFGNIADHSKHLKAELSSVMSALGGTQVAGGKFGQLSYWQFDYYPNHVVRSVVASGQIPDMKSFQYYATPEVVAQHVVELAQITGQDTLLEPEAGQGGIADYLPRDQTTCVEISRLHCDILRTKGHNVIQGDFLKWDTEGSQQFSCIVMNPPFAEGQWQEHLKKASRHVAEDGRIVAVLPLTARRKAEELLPGFTVVPDKTFDNAFQGTSISVTTLIAYKN